MDNPFREIECVALAAETFSAEDAHEIIEAVNAASSGRQIDPKERAAELAGEINQLSAFYVADDYQQDTQPAAELIARLEKIARQAEKLAKTLGADDTGVDHDLGPEVLWAGARLLKEPVGSVAVADAARGIVQMGRFARKAIEEQKKRRRISRGRPRDHAVAKLVRGLARCFEEEWDEHPVRGIERGGDRLGRFPLFLQLVLARLAPHQYTPHGIDGLVQRHLLQRV